MSTLTTRVRIVNYMPLEVGGGGESFAISVGNALAPHFDIEYLAASNFRGFMRTDGELVSSRIRFRYRRIPFRKPPCPILARLARPVPDVEELVGSDVILFFVDRPVCPAYFQALAREASVVLLLHGFTLELPRPIAGKANLMSAWTLMMGAAMALGTQKLVESNVSFQIYNGHQRRYLRLLGVPSDQVYFIRNGLPFGQYCVGRNDDQFRVAFVGRIERLTKGVDYLIDVARWIIRSGTPISFDILGSGPSSGGVERFSRTNKAVRYHGFVSQEEKVRILERANLLVSTSTIEPFSLAVTEGLAAGLPVVSTPASGPTSILSLDSSFGSVAFRGARSFAHLVLEYYNRWTQDKEEYFHQKLHRRGLARVPLDLTGCVAGYRQMIESVKGRRGLHNDSVDCQASTRKL